MTVSHPSKKILRRCNWSRLIQVSLEEGDGWLHKYVNDERKESLVICSDLIVRGLPAQDIGAIKKIFKDCGESPRVEAGKKGKDTAVVHFIEDEGRSKASLVNNKDLAEGTTVLVEGLKKRYTNDPMDILQAHTDTWGNSGRLASSKTS